MQCTVHYPHQTCMRRCHKACNQHLDSWHPHHAPLDTHNDQSQCSSQNSHRTHRSQSSWHPCLRPQCLTQQDRTCTACYPHQTCMLWCHKHCIQHLPLWHPHHTQQSTHNDQSQCSSLHWRRTRKSQSSWHPCLRLQCSTQQDRTCTACFQHLV